MFFAVLRLEELIPELKKNYTIIIVTHNMQQLCSAQNGAWDAPYENLLISRSGTPAL
jgi:ABC-type transporter Mla maintaining outer membrane lipid asymmetry ATPase subunit MlaF